MFDEVFVDDGVFVELRLGDRPQICGSVGTRGVVVFRYNRNKHPKA